MAPDVDGAVRPCADQFNSTAMLIANIPKENSFYEDLVKNYAFAMEIASLLLFSLMREFLISTFKNSPSFVTPSLKI
jgi:hypothetical protein